MPSLPSAYAVVSRFAGGLLLAAGGLQAYDLHGSSLLAEGVWWREAFAAFEVLLGFWVMVGLHPRWTRLVLLVCFLGFLNVALTHAWEGRKSCGCFGEAVSARPWHMVGLDATIIAALLFSSPLRMPGLGNLRAIGTRWTVFGITVFALGTYFGVRLSVEGLQTAKFHPPESVERGDLDRAIEALDRNHAALPAVVYTTEETTSSMRPAPPPKGSGGNGLPISKDQMQTRRFSSRCVIRGDEYRRDLYVCDEKAGIVPRFMETLINSRGRRIQHRPDIRQGWVMVSADQDFLGPIDARCAGFRNPISSIANWLRNCTVLAVERATDRSGRGAIRVRAVWEGPSYKNEMTADLVPDFNYLPSRVVYRFTPGGSIWTVTDVDYAQVGPGRGWFPKEIAARHFLRNTNNTDPDADHGFNVSKKILIQVLAVSEPVSDEEFDPEFPPKTVLLGDLAKRLGSTGEAAMRASAAMREEPLQVTPGKPKAASLGGVWLSIALDLSVIGLAAVFRRRFAF
jgi:hypothetical protein